MLCSAANIASKESKSELLVCCTISLFLVPASMVKAPDSSSSCDCSSESSTLLITSSRSSSSTSLLLTTSSVMLFFSCSRVSATRGAVDFQTKQMSNKPKCCYDIEQRCLTKYISPVMRLRNQSETQEQCKWNTQAPCHTMNSENIQWPGSSMARFDNGVILRGLYLRRPNMQWLAKNSGGEHGTLRHSAPVSVFPNVDLVSCPLGKRHVL